MRRHRTNLSRRAMIRGTAALALGSSAVTPGCTGASRATYVLVHGAWHGGWCWQRVADILVRGGHQVYAPTLSGLGERSHLGSDRIDLTTHVLDVVNEVKWKDLDGIVLCGHSYGGMVITGAAEQIEQQIASIVYLDAFVPENRQSLEDIIGAALPADDGLIAPFPAERFNVNEADRAWVNSKLTPQSAACFSERLSLTGAAGRIAKKTYIRARVGDSSPFRAAFERLSADPQWATYTVDCGHDVMIDKPEELAELLVRSA